jgi:hypothetical protein
MNFSWRKKDKVYFLYKGSKKFAELFPIKINITTKYYWVIIINNQIIFNNKLSPIFGKKKAMGMCLEMVKEELRYL